ncbi:hypothetical protein AB0D56_37880, partial [Streptomyces sp. NPDC048209]|uniref:hypothetical protein n=1 Tax=Streptomyces sp. NPDC048209 TaxID=3156689 RepID=UPI00343F2B1F
MSNRFENARESARARAERVWKGMREVVTDNGDPVVIQSHAATLPDAAPSAPKTAGRGARLRYPRPSGPAETASLAVATVLVLAVAAGLVWGAVWLLITLIVGAAHLIAAAGVGLWHGLQAVDHAVSTSQAWHDLVRLGGYLSGPVHAWLERHADVLPFSVRGLFAGWWLLGLFVWWRARRNRGLGVLAFAAWAGTSAVVMWAGAEPEARTATLVMAGLVAAPLTLPLLPRGLFSAHVTVEAPKTDAPKAEPAAEAGPAIPAPRP